MDIEYNKIKEYVHRAMDEVYQKDTSLIARNANERSIVFRFGLYLYEIFQSSELKDYDVDVEYNRNGNDPKRTPSHQRYGIVPDLIVHKRESNDYNLLALEFKTEWNDNQSGDVKKIKELTSDTGEYRFKCGATILIGKDRPRIEWF